MKRNAFVDNPPAVIASVAKQSHRPSVMDGIASSPSSSQRRKNKIVAQSGKHMKRVWLLLLIPFCLLANSTKPEASKSVVDEVARGVEKSLEEIRRSTKKLESEIESGVKSGKKRTKAEVESAKASLETLKDSLRKLGDNVTDEVNSAVKRLNKLSEEIQ